MFEKEAEEYANEYGQDAFTQVNMPQMIEPVRIERKLGFQKGAEITLRKVIKYFSTIVLDENCGGYFSQLLENEEKLQELAKELDNV